MTAGGVRPGLVAFDMDGTLIEGGVSWEILHKAMGTWEAARANMEAYLSGEISYDEWFRRDVGLWVGRRIDAALEALRSLRPVEGAVEAIRRLRSEGTIVGIVSSGLDVVMRGVLGGVELDFAEVNGLELGGDGVVVGWEIRVPFSGKGRIVRETAESFGVPLGSVAVVGDAENDLSMFALPVGLRVAFRPKSRDLAESADAVVWGSLTDVADLIVDWFRAGRSTRRPVK